MLDRKQLREFRECRWASADELRTFTDAVGAVSRKDIEALLEILLVEADPSGPHHKNRCVALRRICLAAPDPAHFVPLAQAIVRADPTLRKVIAATLTRSNDVDSHGLLCAALGAPDPDARAVAASVLEQVGGPSALRELVKLVAQPSFAGRREALDVMAPKARHRALDLIQAVLRSGSVAERIRAIELAGDTHIVGTAQEAAISVLVQSLDDPDRRASAAAFEAFARLAGAERFLDALEPKLEAAHVGPVLVEALGHAASERSVELLHTCVRRGPRDVRLAAIGALRRIGSPATIDALIDALHVEDAPVQRAASEAVIELGVDGRVDIAELLLQLLASPHPHVRPTATQLAAHARGRESSELTERLLSSLREEDWWVRERVLDAIVVLGFPELAAGLSRYLSDESPVIRRSSLFGLLRLRDPATLGAILRTAVTDPDWVGARAGGAGCRRARRRARHPLSPGPRARAP